MTELDLEDLDQINRLLLDATAIADILSETDPMTLEDRTVNVLGRIARDQLHAVQTILNDQEQQFPANDGSVIFADE